MANLKDRRDEELYNRLDSAYPTEDEDSEVITRLFHNMHSRNSLIIHLETY